MGNEFDGLQSAVHSRGRDPACQWLAAAFRYCTIHHTAVLHRKLAIPDAINHLQQRDGQTTGNTKELEVMDWWRRRADASLFPSFLGDMTRLPQSHEHIAIWARNREDGPRLRYSSAASSRCSSDPRPASGDTTRPKLSLKDW
ncbi:hypothetical protein C8F01DRAFT_1233230 [Mycena amicta]|nr:hypothetical protein C8F01DRAFT_1233230 [Mycena amicta]